MAPDAFLATLAGLPDEATVPVGWLRAQLALPGGAPSAPADEMLTADEVARRLAALEAAAERRGAG